ncbi:MAG: type IV-A pilus assembly ATPase PilB [Acidobacteriota bacterium]|jgi:type IV pilus assembly protein PilB|nr:type IV-A pilus assembly ATPase PilB [Acidobacteriota bacterium]OQB58062.1 MAG: Type II secretion system protein E [Candidatus Aminicenantes bacterium ADurb.Bin147]HNQ80747.1 type IV-A pilus assembly ATPase PilB [Candidatus Aminicenantes bacterium]MDD8028593.1 type IV-A pilus assembly ATPase PilB [Acidobacteriota bacterium]MDD8033313.1 type IV-A pilus assembly ATPase PilB [Acidobacteriota bacterium]
MASTIGDVLLKEKILTAEQLKTAQDFQKKHDILLSSAIVSLNYVSGEEMAQGLSRQLGYPYIDLDQFEVYPDVISLITADTAKKSLIMPIHRIRSFLTLAMVDPTDMDVIEDIRFRTGLSIQPVIASESSILNAINKYYGAGTALRVKKNIEEIELADDSKISAIDQLEEIKDEPDEEEIEEVPDEAPIITLVNNIFVEAIKKGASDVHFEPYEKSFRVRYRIDGILYETMNLPLKFKNPLTSRVKIMSNMDIAEKRLPQDGRIKMRAKLDKAVKKEVDMRISCLPTIFGEKIVARILDRDNLNIDLNKLGFESESLAVFQRAIARPWGIILVSGPTGSGKTNTLYSAISTLNGMEKNIMTAEDPVEFYIPGINQVNIRDEINLNFAAALRAFLRQDPDIMLIGEMRDQETVDVAIKAALTGHLVFSTIHTNDSAATIHRLMNMNIEPFLIADSLALVVAQRLVRRVCKKCAAPTKLPVKSLVEMGFTSEEAEKAAVMQGRGCDICHNSGYKGRTALFEVMELNPTLREMILLRAQSKEIKQKAVEAGMITMRRSGLIKIMAGITTPEEVLRETVRD